MNQKFSKRCPCALFLIATLFLGRERVQAQEGASARGVKAIGLQELRRRARFSVFVPQNTSAYRLRSAQLAWIAKDNLRFPKLPARQAACLYYTFKNTEGVVALIQARSLGRSVAWDNLYQPVAQGYFFGKVKVNSRFGYFMYRNTDCLVISYFPKVSKAKQEELLRPFLKLLR